MRLAEVQADDIIAAGRQLESVGSPVNGWTLRRALGDKGRPDQLIEVWQSHRGVASVASAGAGPHVLPPDLAELADRGRAELATHYDGLVRTIFSHADSLLRERYAAELDRLVADRCAMQEQLEAAGASVIVTEAALSKVRASVERMREALAMAQAEIVRSEKRGQAAEAEARCLRDQAARLASSAEAARGEAAALSAEVAAARAEKAGEQQRADRAEQEGAAAQKAAAAASLASAALRSEAQQLRGKVAQLTSALDTSQSRALLQEQRAQRAEQDLAHALDEQRKREEKTGIIYIT